MLQTIRLHSFLPISLKKCPICIICFVIFVLIALVAIILGLIPIYVSSSGEAQFANIGVGVNNAFQNDLQSTNLFLAISSNDSNQTNATSADVDAYKLTISEQVRRDIIQLTKLPCKVTIGLAPVLPNTATSVSVRRKRNIGECDAVAGQNILIGSINVLFFGPTNLISSILNDSLSNPSSYLNIQQTVCNGSIVPTNTNTSSSTVAATTLTITTSTSSTTTTTTLTTTTLTTSKVSSTSAASTTTSEIISSSPSSEFTSSPFSTFTSESSSFSF